MHSECDKSRTYVSEVRQYYGPDVFSQVSPIGTRSTYAISQGFQIKGIYIYIYIYIDKLTYLGMKHDWTDGTKECRNQL